MAHRELLRVVRGSVLGVCFSATVAGPAIASAVTLSPRPQAVNLADAAKEEEPKGDPIDVDKLPKAVVDAVKKAYPGAKITKAAKLEDGNYFLDDVKVGKKVWDLTVSPKGMIIRQVEMKEGP